jgi:hypothetical protein
MTYRELKKHLMLLTKDQLNQEVMFIDHMCYSCLERRKRTKWKTWQCEKCKSLSFDD